MKPRIKFDPNKNRDGECIGGGFFVFRRGKKTGRVGIRSTLPFEHESYWDASQEVERLEKENPGEIFVVVAETNNL